MAISIDYRARLVDRVLDELLAQLPGLFVGGPRGVGKTTTLSRRAATIVRLDEEPQAAVVEGNPDAALRGLDEPVLLDEWQLVPSVLGAVKRSIDADPRPGRYLVTGSVRAELDREAWPATGRLVRVPIYPMTVREQLQRLDGSGFLERIVSRHELSVPPSTPDLRGYVELALRGGFPYPALRLSGSARRGWLQSYVTSLLTHDVEQLEQPSTRGRDVGRLGRYLEAYALNSAGVTDHKTIYDTARVNKATAASYEHLLSRLYLVEQVPGWTSNRLKRLVLQPKRYVIDPALIAAVLHVDEQAVMRDGNLLGRLLETFVAAQLRPELALETPRPQLHHLRTEQGRHEVDLLVELGLGRVVAIEVKATAAPRLQREAKHLVWLRDELGDRFVAGVVLHTGPYAYQLGERIFAAPISVLWA